MKNKIQPVSKSETIDYSNKTVLNFWKQKPNVSVNQNHKNEILKTLQTVQEGMVCIQTESLTDKSLIKQIFDITQNFKVRFYILVNEYSKELDLLNEICLIRYEVKNKGSFILVNPNSNIPKGLFFTGQLTEQSIAISQHISRSLNTKEIEELYRHFCYHFWETAKKEVIEKGKYNDITYKPLDIFHDIHAFGEKDFVYGTLFDFLENEKRGYLPGQQIILLNEEIQVPTLIKPSTTIHLNDNISNSLLPKTVFESQKPIFVDDNVSVSTTYKWQNIPFYLPEKAIIHSLYDRWKKKNEEIVKVLDSILQKIQEAEKKEKSLSGKIIRFFLGKKTVFIGLKDEIENFKKIDFPNLTEAKLKEKISRIYEINVQVQNEIGEIEEEDRKAKLNEEIANLETQILEQENKKQEAEEKKQEKEAKKSDIEKTIAQVEAELKLAKEAFEKEKKEKLSNFCAKHKIEVNALNKSKNEWQQKASKKNDNKTEKEEAQNILDDLKTIENSTFPQEEWNKKVATLQEEIRALFLQKTLDNIKEIEKKINSLRNQIESKEKEKTKSTQSSNSSSLNELIGDKSTKQGYSGKTSLIQFPDLQQLPTIGKLYQVNQQSYLAIEFWEEYEVGANEAERLNAELCTIQ